MELTTRQYAEKRNITMQAVTKAIRLEHALPGVKRVKRFNKDYVLIVDLTSLENFLKL